MSEVDHIKDQVYRLGFLTESQIKIRVKDHKAVVKEIKKDPHIHEVKYTNTYVSSVGIKKMYIYNPHKKKRTKRKK